MNDRNWVRGTLSYNSRICQYVGRKRAACAQCVQACPHEALLPGNDTIEIDLERCTDCGDCVAACPSGALALRIAERNRFAELIEGHDSDVIILCGNATRYEYIESELAEETELPPGVVVLQVDHIGTLSEVDFARAVMTTRKAVVVPVFERGDRNRPFVHAAELMGRITEHLFGARLVHVLSDPATFRARIGEIAASTECSRLPESVTETHENRRSVLQAILDAWLRSASGEETAPLVIPHPSFAALTCESERCIACGACANQCKVQALRFIRDKNLLVHTPAACLNCGVCEAICPEQALTLEEGLRLERSFFTERKLARVEALRCAECGRPFSTAKKVRLVSEKLRVVKGDDPVLRDLLTLCPECRTKKAVLTMIHKKPERR